MVQTNAFELYRETGESDEEEEDDCELACEEWVPEAKTHLSAVLDSQPVDFDISKVDYQENKMVTTSPWEAAVAACISMATVLYPIH